jgi:PleD family two-component response regulator
MTATHTVPPRAEALRVLLFEDNALDAALIKKFLQTAGVRQANIHLTDTIPTALQLLTRDSVDVCLVDYYLRPHTGLDLMDEARRFDVNVPFIMLTAMDDRGIDDGALARGAYGFLVKGDLTVEGLERSIRYALIRHRRERTLLRAAAFDDLTGLPNRATFLEKLGQAIDDHRPKGGMLSLLLINMHATRYLNDAYGPEVGDDMLKALADRLRAGRRGSDYIGRLGGDPRCPGRPDAPGRRCAGRGQAQHAHEGGVGDHRCKVALAAPIALSLQSKTRDFVSAEN